MELVREAWKAVTCGIKCWTNALRELAGRWETEGVGFVLARDYRKAQKRRRGSFVKDEGQVFHHLCWADEWCKARSNWEFDCTNVEVLQSKLHIPN